MLVRFFTSLPRLEGGFPFVLSCCDDLLIIGTVALTGPADGIHPPGVIPAGRRLCRPFAAGERLVR
jgi:hypothetical protein